MKNLVYGIIATVLFSINTNANNTKSDLGNQDYKNTTTIHDEPVVGRGKIIRYIISALSSLFSDDTPSSVSATGAYSNGGCDARNTNMCQINYRLSNTKVIDIRDLNTNSTVLQTPVMKKVVALDLTFLSFDELGSVYLTASENTKNKLFISGNVVQLNDANISLEELNYINGIIKEINPKSVALDGVKKGKTLVPEKGGDGFIYIKLN